MCLRIPSSGDRASQPVPVDIAPRAIGPSRSHVLQRGRGGCPGVSGAGPQILRGHQLGTSCATHFIGVGVPGARVRCRRPDFARDRLGPVSSESRTSLCQHREFMPSSSPCRCFRSFRPRRIWTSFASACPVQVVSSRDRLSCRARERRTRAQPPRSQPVAPRERRPNCSPESYRNADKPAA